MITFISSITLLILGYFFYGKFIEKNFGIDDQLETPAIKYNDGTDYIPMSKGKNTLIQLLNIAGTGPIFGPVMGALYGPVAFIWIVAGCIFAGAVHDYLTGMISMRHKGAHLPELAGIYLGKVMKHVVNLFAALLLLLVGTVFVTSPAALLANLTPDWLTVGIISIGIFVYYILATLLPIDVIIGKVYPYFGALLLISALGISFVMISTGADIPEITFKNLHPDKIGMLPGLFFTISCGALSGFHATQSPIISRTLKKESEGRFVFYGMMIAEGIIAMIWAAAAMSSFNGAELSEIIKTGTASKAVDIISKNMLGAFGGTLAVLGVIVLPITSGDTAFRSFRMIIADYLKIPQKNMHKRLIITVPLFVISYVLTKIDFNILWRYFNWANQATAVIALLVATRYLYLKGRIYIVTLIPATFMLYCVLLYILTEKIGFNLSFNISYILAAVFTIILIGLFLYTGKRQKENSGGSLAV